MGRDAACVLLQVVLTLSQGIEFRKDSFKKENNKGTLTDADYALKMEELDWLRHCIIFEIADIAENFDLDEPEHYVASKGG